MIFKWIGLLISYTFNVIKFVYQVFIYVYQIFIYTALRRSFDSLIKILLFNIYIYILIMSNLIHFIGVEIHVDLKKKKKSTAKGSCIYGDIILIKRMRYLEMIREVDEKYYFILH